MSEAKETTDAADAARRVEVLVMPSLRSDIMDAIKRYTDTNEENAKAQSRTTADGIYDALQYKIKAESAQGIALFLHHVLSKHGL